MAYLLCQVGCLVRPLQVVPSLQQCQLAATPSNACNRHSSTSTTFVATYRNLCKTQTVMHSSPHTAY
jgi:hypothetical protein